MGIPRSLQDFYVKLVASGAEYKSFVQQSPAGQGKGRFTPPVERTKLEQVLRHLSAAIPESGRLRNLRPAGDPDSPYQPETIGDGLGKSLFTDDVRLLYARSLGILQSKAKGLRISIHLDLSDPEVAWLGQLPWELIRDEHRYLLLNPLYSLARCLDLSGPPPPARIKQPLKILVVLASPGGYSELSVEQEFRELEKSFRNSHSVRLKLLEHATWEALGRRVREEPFHVVHFVGHAEFDSESGRGCLLLETDSGEPNLVAAEQLAALLHGEVTTQLLVLNACETASFSWKNDHDPWNGLATALLMAGFPAVVAMQFPISDKAAVAFSRGFYGLLATGHRVDLALTGGRQAIFLDCNTTLEWVTPVLFLRGMQGSIFRIDTRRPRQRTLVIEVHGECQAILPQYEEKLVAGITKFLEIAPSDLKSVYAADKGRFTIKLPANAADCLLKAAESTDAEFERLRAELSIVSIQTASKVPFLPGVRRSQAWRDTAIGAAPPQSRISSALITFGLGILGNLIAAWLEKELLHYSFTLPRIATLLLLTLIFLHWDLFARIRRKLGSKRVIATLIACAALLASFAIPAILVGPHPDCDGLEVSRVELDLPMASHPIELNLAGNHVTDLREEDLQGIQHLSGRAVLSNPGAHCLCEWSGKTDQEQNLADLGVSADCAFSIDLPNQYNWIDLQLKVGNKKDLFVIHVE